MQNNVLITLNKRIILFSFSLFLLSAMVLTSAVAQPRIVGVDAGDWFKYGDFTATWSSNDPNATWPIEQEGLKTLNETEWVLISIEDISGTNVTTQITAHSKNGTEGSTSGYIDIDTGDSSVNMIYAGIISADLGENDSVYSSVRWSNLKINETIFRTYPDASRDTNHVNVTGEIEIVEPIYVYSYLSTNHYWDQSSGILVELSIEQVSQIGDILTSWSFSMRIIESNVWVIPEFPTWISILLTFAILTISMVMIKRRLLKTLIH